MRPLARRGANKSGHARHFRHNVQHTKAPNMKGGLMRGGWRL